MTKKQMVRQIASRLEVDQIVAKKTIQMFLDGVIDVIEKTGRLELRNFGVFEVRERSARKARNPKTNEEIFVPAKRVVTFQAGKNVLKRLKERQPAVQAPGEGA